MAAYSTTNEWYFASGNCCNSARTYRLQLQDDGNLVFYVADTRTILWQTNRQGALWARTAAACIHVSMLYVGSSTSSRCRSEQDALFFDA